MKTPLSPRFFLVAGAAFAAVLLSPTQSFAQDQVQEATAPSTKSGAGAKKASTSLEEVLVTARRRHESLQETPIAVTAISGAELQERGIVNIGELTKSIPSVEITESVSNLIYIRGIGQRSAFARVDPTVGVYLDNIFLPRADGRRPAHGEDRLLARDPHWRDLVLFHEYFDGDSGRGLGASHQTGWTALVTSCLEKEARRRGRARS